MKWHIYYNSASENALQSQLLTYHFACWALHGVILDMFQICYEASGKGPCVSVQAGVSLREYVKKDRYYHDILCMLYSWYSVYYMELKIIFFTIIRLTSSIALVRKI